MRYHMQNKRFAFYRDLSYLCRPGTYDRLILLFLPDSLKAYHQVIFITPPEKSDPALFDHTVVGF